MGEKHLSSFLNYILRANYQSEVLVTMQFKHFEFKYFHHSNTPVLRHPVALLSIQPIISDLAQMTNYSMLE